MKGVGAETTGHLVKIPPEMAGCKCFECVQWRPDMSVNEIIDLAMKVDAA
jgi:hypothetical protein